KGSAGQLALSGRNDARTLRFAAGNGDRTFVGVRGKSLDAARPIIFVLHYGVQRVGGLHALKISVRSGVVVRPGDVRALGVVNLMATGIGFGVLRVEVIGIADAAKRAERD